MLLLEKGLLTERGFNGSSDVKHHLSKRKEYMTTVEKQLILKKISELFLSLLTVCIAFSLLRDKRRGQI
jgi:hypothetical protein